ncbi:MAG: SAM-dependent methyltransferase [Actinomycetota bacterium]|nr:SAM-dependent methyltransferase [Actinomycetota bacterium]
MLVDFRPISKLRGKKPVDVTAALGPVLDALAEDSVDLSRIRVVCDWVQYRNNFRDVVDIRPILAAHGTDSVLEPVSLTAVATEDEMEVAIDVRRSSEVPLKELTGDLIRACFGDAQPSRIHLEPWRATSASLIWDFNALYWKALDLWEQATGRAYESALPGGESDARNRDSVREIITDLFALWDSLAERNALPEELYVVEIGPGNGNQAKTWLDEFVELDRRHGKEYYRRLQYLMCDYSPHVLELARAAVAHHAEHVSSFVLDATQPRTALGFLRYKVFLVYISNVYDNLPTDEVAQIGGRTYIVQTRAYLSKEAATEIGQLVSTQPDGVPELIRKLLRLGPALLAEAAPAHFPSAEAAVEFWRRTWEALRLEERYLPLVGLDLYQIAPTVSGEMLRPLLESGATIRMHVNNGAVASFVDTLPLLHPYGRLICHDLFVTDVHAYRTGFRGPGKYDGSIVNWLNGPLLAHIGRRKGFDVNYQSFAYRTGTNIITMTAQVRD